MHSHDEIAELLGPDGPFVGALPGFEARSSQISMASAVQRCLRDKSSFIVESGTGTGKTFAYLVPAALSGQKVIVSTGTKPLQDQLFFRDLPTVLEVLKQPVKTALLKGRANYLCLHRLQLARQQMDIMSGGRSRDLAHVEDWSRATRSGDLNELTVLTEDSAVRPMVSSTVENCLGSRCEFYDECYVNRARQAALGAELLVVNHHLFCADLVLREDGFGQLLPGADAIIFDEAHQLAEVASDFLGTSIGTHQIRDLCRDVEIEEKQEQSQVQGLGRVILDIEQKREALLDEIKGQRDRLKWSELSADLEFSKKLGALLTAVSELTDHLQLAATAGEGLLRCWQRALVCAERLSRFTEPAGDRYIRWAETDQRWCRFHETPLQLGDTLKPYLEDPGKGWFYTSATLSVKGDFSYFAGQLGIENAETMSLDSPFDYTRQARLYIPVDLPDPRQPHFTRAVVDKALPVIDVVGGRTFFLFTSHNALREAHSILSDCSDYCLLAQGHMPRTELLARFRSTPRSILLGTASFWEGVDVRGEALSCVIIDKLPFASPSDPVLRARLEAIESSGGRPFIDYQLPQAVIALKQGVGRLIRDSNDFGVLMLCDPRLIEKSYGKVFLDSLPAIPMTRTLDEVKHFFNTAVSMA